MHVAIIMDGNGRWAKEHQTTIVKGHKAGALSAKTITQHAFKKGIETLTLYAFSSENWKREEGWLNQFFQLIYWYIKEDLQELFENDIRLKIIGDISNFPFDLKNLLILLQERTQNHKKMTLCLALGYGGRDEIVRAIKALTEQEKLNLTEDLFKGKLDTGEIPYPDLLIRTSGEKRLSNFLLWQIAYTELYFSNKLWPDFCPDDFDEALRNFTKRERRFGA
jgi:undecaprenyl diphosphate synthase